MKTLGVTTALHDATRELVDDFHFAIDDNVVFVEVEQEMCAKSLLQVIRQLARRVGVDILDSQAGLDLRQTAFGGHDGTLRLVHLEVFVAHEAKHGLGRTSCTYRPLSRRRQR